ncbi:MAG: hypothetical protein JEZ11_10060 [Desulfobacterales bacterium]|nr:hypothetical protein [Desulfobacterales bacterium]
MATSNAIKGLCAAVAICALATVSGLDSGPAMAGLAYKNYLVRQDSGREILCDPYVVREKDWVLKIFKLRGEIAQADFPRFLKLFKRINPHIRDIDTIRPGQHILIPLKELSRSLLAEDPAGIVRVPFLALSKGGRKPGTTTTTTAYQILRGDCVSKLVAGRFGDYGTDAYRNGLRRFQLANPTIKDLSRIYVGQWVQLPDLDGMSVPATGATSVTRPSTDTPTEFAPVRTGYDLYDTLRQNEPEPSGANAGLEQAASVLDAKLLDKGIFYFPRQGSEDLPMDMAEVPVMTLSDGRRLLFHPPDWDAGTLIDAVRNHWNNASPILMAPGSDMASILDAVSWTINGSEKQTHVELTADGLHFSVQARWILPLPASEDGAPGHLCITVIDDPSQRTPAPLTRYLADRQIIIRDVVRPPASRTEVAPKERPCPPSPPKPIIIKPAPHRAFVRNLIFAMGYRYAENVTITFPYAGIQVSAVSNLVTTPGGTPLFVDFEDLYGDAVEAIEKSGFRIVQITRDDRPGTMVKKLLTAMEADVTENPAILATGRPADKNTTVMVPGFLVRNADTDDLLFTDLDLNPAISDFLSGKGIRIIELSRESGPGNRPDLEDKEA